MKTAPEVYAEVSSRTPPPPYCWRWSYLGNSGTGIVIGSGDVLPTA